MPKPQSGIVMLALASLLFTTVSLAQQIVQQGEMQSQQNRKLRRGQYQTHEVIEPMLVLGQSIGAFSADPSQPCTPDIHPWQLVTTKDGIQIFSQQVSGSEFKAYIGTVTVQASLDEAISLLVDSSKCDALYDKCRRSEILYNAGKNEKYVYVVYDVPWPYRDRDVVVHATSFHNPEQQTFTLRYVGKPNYIPKQSRFVRIANLRASWRLEAKWDNELRITYQTYSDPGGNLSPSLANNSNKTSTMKTLQNIRSLLTS